METGISGRIFELAERSLDEWESGGRGLDALVDALRDEAPAERPAVASTLLSYFRRKAFIDALIESHATRGKVKPPLRRILAIAATQALTQTGIAPQSAVNIAVDFTKEVVGEGAASFVNAVLRSIGRSRPDVPTHTSLPERLEGRWKRTSEP